MKDLESKVEKYLSERGFYFSKHNGRYTPTQYHIDHEGMFPEDAEDPHFRVQLFREQVSCTSVMHFNPEYQLTKKKKHMTELFTSLQMTYDTSCSFKDFSKKTFNKMLDEHLNHLKKYTEDINALPKTLTNKK